MIKRRNKTHTDVMKKEHTYKRESKTYIPKVHTHSIRTYIHTYTQTEQREREKGEKGKTKHTKTSWKKNIHTRENKKLTYQKYTHTQFVHTYTHTEKREREKW